MVVDISFDVNYDPNDNNFSDWLASKFNNHKTMDRATKNVLWVYWMRGEDEETEMENESLCDDSTLTDNMEELFSIDIDVFDYETPLCKQFKEFNYLLQIDTNIFMDDEYLRNTWYYEWNDQVPWVENEPGRDYETWDQLPNNMIHTCQPFRFKDG